MFTVDTATCEFLYAQTVELKKNFNMNCCC